MVIPLHKKFILVQKVCFIFPMGENSVFMWLLLILLSFLNYFSAVETILVIFIIIL